MSDSEHDQSFSLPPQEPEGRNWAPIIAGAGVVLLIIVAFVLVAVLNRSPGVNPGDPYLNKLQLSNLHMATAENFAGGSVTYIEGTLTNAGDRKVTGAGAQVTFKNSLEQITQKETLPLTVLVPNSPYVDYGTLDRAPLAPGQSRSPRNQYGKNSFTGNQAQRGHCG